MWFWKIPALPILPFYTWNGQRCPVVSQSILAPIDPKQLSSIYCQAGNSNNTVVSIINHRSSPHMLTSVIPSDQFLTHPVFAVRGGMTDTWEPSPWENYLNIRDRVSIFTNTWIQRRIMQDAGNTWPSTNKKRQVSWGSSNPSSLFGWVSSASVCQHLTARCHQWRAQSGCWDSEEAAVGFSEFSSHPVF